MKQIVAAILEDPTRPLVLAELPVPPLAPGQVLVEMKASGICHTQLLEIRGQRGPDRFLPHLLGHEGSGIVRDIGAGVTRVKPGDAVVVSWLKNAGLQSAPPTYRQGERLIRAGLANTLGSGAIVSENSLSPIPAGLPWGPMALLGCAIPTGSGTVRHTAQVSAGQSVLILGAGGIGIAAVQAAALAQAHPIIAVDVQDDKLALALALGATHAINASAGGVSEQVWRLTENQGVDIAIETAGRVDTSEQAFALSKVTGGLTVFIGNIPQQQSIRINPFDLIRGKRVMGSWGGSSRMAVASIWLR